MGTNLPENGQYGRTLADETPAVRLLEEEAVVTKRRVEETIRVETVTQSRDELIDEELHHEDVEVERVPVGRYVDAVPPVREDGDVTILSVVEEVFERRLILREEVHVRRVRRTEHHRETVSLRKQEAVVTRVPTTNPNKPTSDAGDE